jgi:hypothetical protein
MLASFRLEAAGLREFASRSIKLSESGISIKEVEVSVGREFAVSAGFGNPHKHLR